MSTMLEEHRCARRHYPLLSSGSRSRRTTEQTRHATNKSIVFIIGGRELNESLGQPCEILGFTPSKVKTSSNRLPIRAGDRVSPGSRRPRLATRTTIRTPTACLDPRTTPRRNDAFRKSRFQGRRCCCIGSATVRRIASARSSETDAHLRPLGRSNQITGWRSTQPSS